MKFSNFKIFFPDIIKKTFQISRDHHTYLFSNYDILSRHHIKDFFQIMTFCPGIISKTFPNYDILSWHHIKDFSKL